MAGGRLGAIAAGIVILLAGQAPGDAFVAQRDAAAALNPGGPRLTIAAADNRTTFRMGERIPLVFTYDGLYSRRGHHPHDTYVRYAVAVIDRPGATPAPYDDFDRAALRVEGGVSCGCDVPSGGLVSPPRFGGFGFDDRGIPYQLPDLPPPPPPKPPAFSVTFLLNEGVRFDVPGRYRLYIADRGEAQSVVGQGKPRPKLISNILELQIIADDRWADATVREAAALLDASRDPAARSEAARTLRFLGTRSAIDEMARRQEAVTAENYLEMWEVERGLFGAHDRDYAIAAMERRVDDPAARIAVHHLRVTAALRLTRDKKGPLEPADKQRALLSVDERRLRVLARSGSLEARLRATFSRTPRGKGSVPAIAVTPALGGAAPLVEKVLRSLSRSDLDSALAAYGTTLADDDRLAPMLERLVARGSRIANVLVYDLTLPPDAPLTTVDAAASPYVVAGVDARTHRRRYLIGNAHVPFTGLAAAFSQFPPGSVLTWADEFDMYLSSWLLNRDREFHRVEEIARRHGVTLKRP